MPQITADERAKRAIVRAANFISPDFVKITKDDPGDQNPSASAFQFSPSNLLDLTFDNAKVNIANPTLARGFVKALREELTEISSDIQSTFGTLDTGVRISSVFFVISDLLAEANASAGSSKNFTPGKASAGVKKSAKKAGKTSKASKKSSKGAKKSSKASKKSGKG